MCPDETKSLPEENDLRYTIRYADKINYSFPKKIFSDFLGKIFLTMEKNCLKRVSKNWSSVNAFQEPLRQGSGKKNFQVLEIKPFT